MPETLKNAEGNHEQNASTDKVPEFDPDRAQALRAEALRETATNVDDDSSETTHTDEAAIETSAQRLDLNRDAYNNLLKRKLFLTSQYPDLEAAPKSIQDEYAASSAMLTYLTSGVEGTIHGTETVADKVSGQPVAIDSFHQSKYENAAEKIQQAREQNRDLLDVEAEAKFELPTVNVTEFKEQLNNATSVEEVMALAEKIHQAESVADLDAVYALRDLDLSPKLKVLKEREDVMSQTQKLEDNLAAKENALATAQADYKKAGLFKKLGLKMSGKANFKAMQQAVDASRNAVQNWQNSDEYKKFFAETNQ